MIFFPYILPYLSIWRAMIGLITWAAPLVLYSDKIRKKLVVFALCTVTTMFVELWVAVLLSGLFAFYACRLVWQSHAFNDMSTSNDATPLWIPQLAMAVGTVLLCVALVDEWVLELRGRRAHDMHSEEALHNE